MIFLARRLEMNQKRPMNPQNLISIRWGVIGAWAGVTGFGRISAFVKYFEYCIEPNDIQYIHLEKWFLQAAYNNK